LSGNPRAGWRLSVKVGDLVQHKFYMDGVGIILRREVDEDSVLGAYWVVQWKDEAHYTAESDLEVVSASR